MISYTFPEQTDIDHTRGITVYLPPPVPPGRGPRLPGGDRLPHGSPRRVAPGLLRVPHVHRAAGGPHLLQPPGTAALWQAPRRAAQA